MSRLAARALAQNDRRQAAGTKSGVNKTHLLSFITFKFLSHIKVDILAKKVWLGNNN